MKIAVAILFFTAVFVLAAEQESPSTMSRPVPSIGLDECMVTSPSRFFCTARADLRQRPGKLSLVEDPLLRSD